MSKVPSIKKEQQERWPVLGYLLDSYLQAGLKGTEGYEKYLSAVHYFTDRTPQEIVSSLMGETVQISPDIFIIEGMPQNRLYRLTIGLDNYARAVYDTVTNRKAGYVKLKGVKRRDVPELKAFQYMGHNDLDIPADSSNYAGLF
jgi:hypothetical protein